MQNLFQHTAARRRLVNGVSFFLCFFCCFNTQPPEGGWPTRTFLGACYLLFQHTAARRRLEMFFKKVCAQAVFQHTAARRRLGFKCVLRSLNGSVSTHSRPKAAGAMPWPAACIKAVSTHSRPKAAGASLKSLAPSGFAAPISLGSQEKRERKYNTAFSVTPAFAIS